MQKQGLGDALAAGIDRSLLCSFKKLIVLRSEFLIHVPGNDSGHKQQDSQHVSTFGVLFPTPICPDFLPKNAVLVKGTA